MEFSTPIELALIIVEVLKAVVKAKLMIKRI